MIEALLEVWAGFVQFLQGLTLETIDVVCWLSLGLSLAGLLVYVIRRRSSPVPLGVMVTPLVIWGAAWLARVGATFTGGFASEWLWGFYKLLILVSCGWGLINLVRVLIGRRG